MAPGGEVESAASLFAAAMVWRLASQAGDDFGRVWIGEGCRK